jgi:enterochelin esterase family protein
MKNIVGLFTFLLLSIVSNAQQNVGLQVRSVISPQVNEDNTVTFYLNAPHSSEVSVKGDWMLTSEPVQMTKNSSGLWTYTTEKLLSDLYIYTYTVDGTQIIDPGSVFQIRDVGSLFTYFFINGGKGDQYQVHDVPHGNVIRTWYHSNSLKMDRRTTIYTPAGYENSQESYPVLYLLHGSGGDEEAWITLGCVSRIMDNLIAEGKVKPMIVVMPNGNPSKSAAPGETSENLSYFPSNSRVFPGYKDGSYESAFDEIIGFVESNYRVKKDKKNRAIAGLSMGGFHSLYISANHANTFDYVGLFSPGISNSGVHTEADAYQNIDEKLLRQKSNGYKLYWIGIGGDDSLYGVVKDFRNKLDQFNFPYTYVESSRGHIWSNWRAYLLEFLPQLF